MGLVREANYKEVFDAQMHFRSLLDAMARPGKIVTLQAIDIAVPTGMNRATAYACLALLNGDTSYFLTKGSNRIEEYLSVNTGCLPSELGEADFVLAQGSDDPDFVRFVKEGILTYPETGSSIIVEVELVDDSLADDALQIRLTGPGVRNERMIWVKGLEASWIDALMEKNSEFPLGVDTYLSFSDETDEPCICCLPRSTKIEIV